MRVGLAINSHNPNLEWLQQCLRSAECFDEIVLYVQKVSDQEYYQILSWDIPNIKVFRGESEKNIVDGFNFAIRMLQTDWVCSFCDDDYFIKENVGELCGRIKGGSYENADILHFQVELNSGGLWGESNVSEEGLRQSNMLPHGSFFRKRIFDELGGYRSEIATDWEFWLRASIVKARFIYFERVVYIFRLKNDGAFQRQVASSGGHGEMRQVVLKCAGANG